MKARIAAAVAGFALLATGGASAGSPAQVVAMTPLSMRYFCAQNQGECAGGGEARVAMTQGLMGLLRQVNGQVNRAIRPQREAADVWELNPTSGDCEDYVLSKRSLLMRQGLPAGSLRIAYTHTRAGEPHAVLLVRTSDGDFVLDNLTDSVRTLPASGYTIRSMSSPDPAHWSAG